MTNATNRIHDRLAELRAGGRRGLVPFVCGGHPSLEATAGALRALDGAGAAVIEIGFPFSDPIADGPTIAAAMHDAVSAGVTPAALFDCVRSMRGEIEAGVAAMASVSIIERIGLDAFLAGCVRAGIDGLVLPDVPVQESAPIVEAAGRAGLTATLLVAPTTPGPRAAQIAARSTGFVYVVARTGTTGGGGGVSTGLPERIATLRSATELPIACGFGIASADDVRTVVAHADAAIVGTAIVRRMQDAADAGRDAGAAAGELLAELAAGLP